MAIDQIIQERFWRYVAVAELDNCWLWTAGIRNDDGYGSFRIGSNHGSHRVAYAIAKGLNIRDLKDVVIRHDCDNPPCCNPNHLKSGTAWDNVHDAMERGRRIHLKGQETVASKLTDAQVLEIRRLAALRVNYKEIARKFGIKRANVSHIHLRKTWKHLPDQNNNSPLPPKRTGSRGAELPQSKLTNNQVSEIRQLASTKIMNQTEIARLYDIDKGTVSKIILRQTWRHLP